MLSILLGIWVFCCLYFNGFVMLSAFWDTKNATKVDFRSVL